MAIKFLGSTAAKALLAKSKEWSDKALVDAKAYTDAEIKKIPTVGTASKTAKGTVQIGAGIDVTAAGVISVALPTKVSQLTNDSGYQTAAEVSAIASERINEVVGGASEAYDTLKELEDALKNGDSAVAALTTEVAKKANSADVYTKAQTDSAINTAKTELQTAINGCAKPADLQSLKSNIVEIIETKEAELQEGIDACVKTADLTEFTAAEIEVIAQEVIAGK